jgi:hypothetical protein
LGEELIVLPQEMICSVEMLVSEQASFTGENENRVC